MPGLAEVEIQGCAEGCEHVWGDASYRPAGHTDNGATNSGLEGGKATQAQTQRSTVHQAYCLRCNGWRGSLGLEPTPEMYIAHLVLVFRELKRVLRDDGTCWVNIGDSYAANRGSGAKSPGPKQATNVGSLLGRLRVAPGLKEKDLIGIPWRLAFALQADGWWNRSEIIWAKGVSFCKTYAGSSMPESVCDRPSKSHEQVFLFTKSARYYYDHISVQEQSQGQTGQAANFARTTKDHVIPNQGVAQHRLERKPTQDTGKRNLRSVWLYADPAAEFRAYCASQGVDLAALAQGFVDGQRELKDTWVINPKGSKLKHFASYPPALIEPCIRAGSSERGCCPECGSPWQRVVERPKDDGHYSRRQNAGAIPPNSPSNRTTDSGTVPSFKPPGLQTTGWAPTCGCDAGEPVPCVILDPFVGKGTTLKVAIQLGRRGIGIDLSQNYVEMAAGELDAPIQVRMI